LAESTDTAIPMKIHKIVQATIASSLQVFHLATSGKTCHPGDQESTWGRTLVPSNKVRLSNPIPTSLRINKSFTFTICVKSCLYTLVLNNEKIAMLKLCKNLAHNFVSYELLNLLVYFET
jgi:hypothetical protein